MLRDEVKDLRLAYREREQDHKDLTDERVALTLRLEKSEANAIASNNEMLEVSRRCARNRGFKSEARRKARAAHGHRFNVRLQHDPPRHARAAQAQHDGAHAVAVPAGVAAGRPGGLGSYAGAERRTTGTAGTSRKRASRQLRTPGTSWRQGSPQSPPREAAGAEPARERTRRRGRAARRRLGGERAFAGGTAPDSSRPSTGARDARRRRRSPGGSRAGSLAGSRPTTGGTRPGAARRRASERSKRKRDESVRTRTFFHRRLRFTPTVPSPR